MSRNLSPLKQLIGWLSGRRHSAPTTASLPAGSVPYVAPPAAEHAFSAPLSGVLIPLDEVPDPAFSQRLVGDGIAIRPCHGQLVAPCDGEVITLASTGHALSLRGPAGAEVLLHIGIGTVAMKGKGFEPLVTKGQRVRAGEALIRFDLAAVERHAQSPVSLMLLTRPDLIDRLHVGQGEVSAGRHIVMNLAFKASHAHSPHADAR